MTKINIRQAEDPNSKAVPLPDLIFVFGENADLEIANGDFSQENALFTTAGIQLMTNARDNTGKAINSDDPQGWVGDAIDDGFGEIGSYLWLLQNKFINNSLTGVANDYCEKALSIIKELGVVADFKVNSEVDKNDKRLSIAVELQAKANNEKYNRKFELVWGQIYGG